ncbi:hypothetical protein CMI42_03740 [Candidatus Pacearchaeota archaeon]|nr:hypothetical protein [Candidatus Pacearchaeota archaeon]|tara:strand:- start:787 stop:1314 length:528 start_codon:yes stop_codon:yes gene_type:complete
MNLSKKKALAAKTLKVGKRRINFNSENLSEIKEAITKQDIKSLRDEGVISLRPLKGRKKVERRKRRRGPGKIKKKVNNRKQVYVKITRKLRACIMDLRDKGAIEKELYWTLRKKIRMRDFKSKASLIEYLKGIGVEVNVKIKGSGKDMKKASKVKNERKGKKDKNADDKSKENKK